MEERYIKLVEYIENLYNHKFISSRIVDNIFFTNTLYKNVKCEKCNCVFTLDIDMNKHLKDRIIWQKLYDFDFRFLRHNGDSSKELTCENLIIKNILE